MLQIRIQRVYRLPGKTVVHKISQDKNSENLRVQLASQALYDRLRQISAVLKGLQFDVQSKTRKNEVEFIVDLSEVEARNRNNDLPICPDLTTISETTTSRW